MAKRGIDDPWQATGPLTDKLVEALTAPAIGNRVRWDGKLAGFGLRVTSAGAKAFVFRYRNADGRDRTLTIGVPGAWTLSKMRDHPERPTARERAEELKQQVDTGEDPLAEKQDKISSPTVNDLCDRFEAEHLPRLRPVTGRDYKAMTAQHIRPALGRLKVSAVNFSDVDKMHRHIAAGAPYMANRALAVLSKMFALAIKWRMRTDNPTRGVERCPEHRRERFLSGGEIARLGEVLVKHPERGSARAVQLLLLTGARRGEMLSARWDEFELETGVWTKPHTNTKQKTDHRIPLSAPALQLLTEMKAEADKENDRRKRHAMLPIPWLFPGKEGAHQTDLKHFWAAVSGKAKLTGVRLHDLRHTHASILASLGMSLPLIGALLGHTQPQTTQRYAHLMDDPLRAATERVGAIVTGNGKVGAEVVPITGRRP